tara:strand:+ start:797 stop:988 length:192 start_codon:yes stop_codon:yes gene_type:complete
MDILRRKMNAETKTALDYVMVSTGVASLVSWLPPIASLLTIIWLSLRIYESDTVQKLLGRNKT